MEFPPFESCKLTTMTLVFNLEGNVSLDPAFSLLPITHIDFIPPKRQRKKLDLPHGNPGDILSIRYSGETRGIVRSASKGYFKNSITIDLSTKNKNVSIKLSRSKIQMCGASSEEQGREGAQYLLDHLLAIQDELDYLQSSEKAEETYEWLVERSKGQPIACEEGKDYEIIIPELDNAPDMRIAKFLSRQCEEFTYYSHLVDELKWILSIKQVTTRPLEIKKVLKVMVNYNYNLEFQVDRYKLYEEMLDNNGFFSSYNNLIEHCVKIKLPYIPEEEGTRKKNKVPCHCFLVYKSGVVTQTGPGEEKMKEPYERFWKCILGIKDKIILKDDKKVTLRRKK